MRSLSDKLDADRKYGLPYTIPKKNLIYLTPNFNGYKTKIVLFDWLKSIELIFFNHFFLVIVNHYFEN